MTLFLVRHAQSCFNASSVPDERPALHALDHDPITKLGQRQAAAVAARLATVIGKEACDLVYSPLLRASETARAIGSALPNASARPELSLAEISIRSTGGSRSVEHSFHALYSLVESIDPRVASRTQIVVTHEWVAQVILVRLLGMPLDSRTWFRLANASLSTVKLDNCVNLLTGLQEPTLAIVGINDVSHLSHEERTN